METEVVILTKHVFNRRVTGTHFLVIKNVKKKTTTATYSFLMPLHERYEIKVTHQVKKNPLINVSKCQVSSRWTNSKEISLSWLLLNPLLGSCILQHVPGTAFCDVTIATNGSGPKGFPLLPNMR